MEEEEEEEMVFKLETEEELLQGHGHGHDPLTLPTEECLMCENPALTHTLTLPSSTSKKKKGKEEVKKASSGFLPSQLYSLQKTFLQVLNWGGVDVRDEEDFDLDSIDTLLPFCHQCFTQVKTLTDTWLEMRLMHEHFLTLKTEVIQAMTTKFSKRRGRVDEETLRRIREGVMAKVKVKVKRGPTSWVKREMRDGEEESESEVPTEMTDMDGRELEDEAHFDFGFDGEDMEEEVEEEVVGVGEKKLLLPVPTHIDTHFEVSFEGRLMSHQLPIREKWKALWECPETRGGLEHLIPLYLRRVTCPICGDKVPPLQGLLREHFSTHSSTYEESGLLTIQEKLLEVGRVMLSGSNGRNAQRKALMRKKFKLLAWASSRQGHPEDTHSVLPHQYRRVKCPTCGKEMNGPTLEDHLRLHNPQPTPPLFRCRECGKGFARAHYMYAHRKVHFNEVNHMTRKFNCDLCPGTKGSVITNKKLFLEHLKTRHPSCAEVLFFHNCDFPSCPHSFRRKEDLITHLATHSPNPTAQPFFCPRGSSCGKVFSLEKHLKEHVERTGHNENRSGSGGSETQDPPVFPCTYCLQVLESESEWRRHESGHGVDVGKDERRHLCDTCGKGFSCPADLYNHVRIVHKNPKSLTPRRGKSVKEKSGGGVVVVRERPPPRVYNTRGSCHLCGKRIMGVGSLKLHLLNVHTYEHRLKCYICGDDFRQLSFLELHLRRHLGQQLKAAQAQKCRFCEKSFGSVALRKHCIQVHREEYLRTKPFFCPLCFLRVETTEALSAHHLERHEGWKCRVCGRQSANKFRHEAHLRTHTGEKPFQCRWCERTFTNITNQKEHEVMRHTGIKPFPCGECEKTFLRKKAREEHQAKDHHSQHVLAPERGRP